MSTAAEAGFAGRLRALRRAAGLRQEDVARAAGMSTSTYRSYEDGRSDPFGKLEALARALDTDLHTLRGWTTNEQEGGTQ